MVNDFIEPTFTLQSDWLTFLSRLWGITITATDLTDYEAYKLLRPVKLITENEDEYWQRRRAWDDSRKWVDTPQLYALTKWDSYRLGKVQPGVESYLSTRPSPNRTQSREAVRLQVNVKYNGQIQALALDVANNLLPLVQGIVW